MTVDRPAFAYKPVCTMLRIYARVQSLASRVYRIASSRNCLFLCSVSTRLSAGWLLFKSSSKLCTCASTLVIHISSVDSLSAIGSSGCSVECSGTALVLAVRRMNAFRSRANLDGDCAAFAGLVRANNLIARLSKFADGQQRLFYSQLQTGDTYLAEIEVAGAACSALFDILRLSIPLHISRGNF